MRRVASLLLLGSAKMPDGHQWSVVLGVQTEAVSSEWYASMSSDLPNACCIDQDILHLAFVICLTHVASIKISCILHL